MHDADFAGLLAQRRRARAEFLLQLYRAVDGSVSAFVSGFELGATLGLDEAEARRVIDYHAEKGSVHVDDHRAGVIRLTAAGVDAVESGSV